MIWGLLGLILVVVVLALAITKKNMGRAVPIATVIIVGIIGFLAWYQDHEISLSAQRIPASEVELVDMRFADGARGVKEISGRIRNHSQDYTLVELHIRASLEDCIDNRCEIINQSDFTLKPSVPPGQARDFREPTHFTSTLVPRGKSALKYQVLSTRGE